jgi:hypothetical protein
MPVPAKQFGDLILGKDMPVLANYRYVEPFQLIHNERALARKPHRLPEFQDAIQACSQYICESIRICKFPVAPDRKVKPAWEMGLGNRSN